MSLLLDALNKADQERKRGGENPNISSNHDAQVSYAKATSGTLLKLLVGGVLLALLLIAVYWLGKKTQQPTVVHSDPVAGAAAQTAAASVSAATVAPSANSESVTQALPNNNIESSEEENIASLYQHQARDTLPITTNTQNVETIVDTPASNPVVATAPPANAAPATSPISLSHFANLPDIQDLPSSVLQKIPSLKYSEHNYNNHGGSVVINGIVRHPQDQLIEGLVIDKILEDGMILHFENYSFKMRAMNTWVNM